VCALAGLNWVKTNGATCTLFVVDASASQGGQAATARSITFGRQRAPCGPGDKIGIVAFGGDARLALPPLEKGQIVADLTVPNASQTNIARALSTALATFPAGMSKRIVLVSDGNENAGDAIEAARAAAADNVPVDVIPAANALVNEATLDRMMTPPTAKRGEPFPVKIVATSLAGGAGVVRLLRDGTLVGEQKVTLSRARTCSVCPKKAGKPGFYTYEPNSSPPGRGHAAGNNRALSFVKVQGKPRILAVEGTPGRKSFSPALGAQNVDVEVKTPGQSRPRWPVCCPTTRSCCRTCPRRVCRKNRCGRSRPACATWASGWR
jgi:hypothetical protein